MDSTASPRLKTTEEEGVRARSLVRNISKIEGHVGTSGLGLERLTSKSITLTDLYKPNNKLVNA